MGKLKKIYDAADRFGSGLSERRLTTYSAACAYYIFMSLVPLVMLVVSLLQFTPLSEELVLDAVSEYVPESLYRIVESIVQGIYSGGGVALTVSIFLTIWSAAASMKALMRGMDSVYDARRREDYFVFSFRACVYMVIFVLMLLLSLIVMVYGEQVQDLIISYLPANRFLQFVFRVINLRFIIVLSILVVVFSVLYKWMPAKKLHYTEQLPGALFSGVSWMLFSYIFSFYISLSNRFGGNDNGSIQSAGISQYNFLNGILIHRNFLPSAAVGRLMVLLYAYISTCQAFLSIFIQFI